MNTGILEFNPANLVDASRCEPGEEVDYVEIASSVTVSATSEATADVVVTGSAVTYDGNTIVLIEFYAPRVDYGTSAASELHVWLYEDGVSIGELGESNSNNADAYGNGRPFHVSRRMTPLAGQRTYSIRASRVTANGSVIAGAGGTAAKMPAYIRITKVRRTRS